jgi:hypothetical protein
VVLVLINSAAASLVNTPFSLSAIASLPYDPVGPYWFLYALFTIQVTATILVVALRAPSSSLAVLGVLSLAVSYGLEDTVVRQAMFHFAFFGFGVLYAETVGVRASGPAWLPAALFAAFAISLAVAMRLGVAFNAPAMLPITLFGGGAMIAISQACSSLRTAVWCRWVSVLGSLSMVIYVPHVIFTATTRIILLKVLDTEQLWVHLPLQMAAGIIGPLLLYRVLCHFGLVRVFGLEGSSGKGRRHSAPPDALGLATPNEQPTLTALGRS